ncbi:MAG: lactonase family protein [Bacteroidota bacterium]|nr:lactonase family protein [Bacteroidota bacterium]
MKIKLVKKVICMVVLAFSLQLISAQHANEVMVFFGTRVDKPDRGFSIAYFDTITGKLTNPKFVEASPAPSYFVIHPKGKRFYSVNALDSFPKKWSGGGISAYKLNPSREKLKLIDRVPSGGAGPCFINFDKGLSHVLVANYNGGTIAVVKLNPDGSFGPQTSLVKHTGKSLNLTRQDKAHAHSVKVDPSGRFVLSCDLGLDKVFIYRYDGKSGTLLPNNPEFVALKPGSGPRHFSFHPNGKFVYVINELSATITVFSWLSDKGQLKEIETVQTLPADFKGANTAAEIEVHPNGKFLYCTNRGHNSISTFSVDSVTGKLRQLQQISSQGDFPRNFAIDPSGRWIILSNHNSDNVAVYRVDTTAGLLTSTGQTVSIPNPYGIQFLKLK